jgi:hypothetical protein
MTTAANSMSTGERIGRAVRVAAVLAVTVESRTPTRSDPER